MTLIYGEMTQDANDGPRTHVLIIGVGAYKHLPGGSEERSDLSYGLGQLSSPVLSALALAEWIVEDFNPVAPLGSVELLVSPSQNFSTPKIGSEQIEIATLDAIKKSFDRWDARCNTHRDNIAVFYFCGHGLSLQTLVLLPCDFGADSNEWNHAIDFRKTYRAMSQNKAFTQCYILDTCQQGTLDLLNESEFGGQSLKRSTVVGGYYSRTALVLEAATRGRRAFAEKNKISYFTETLLDALKGKAASKQSGGSWAVDTDTLGKSVTQLLAKRSAELPVEIQLTPRAVVEFAGNRLLHVLSGPPLVDTSIECDPDYINSYASFYIRNRWQQYDRPPRHGMWMQQVTAGSYDVGVEFPDARYTNHMFEEEFIMPPLYLCTFKVQ
jgi:hypothetical protein